MTTGKSSKYITLISSDGHEFIVPRKSCQVSGTIKAMLQSAGDVPPTAKNEILFKTIPSAALAATCDYFNYKTKYTSCAKEIPEFSFQPDMALEMLIAANLLDC